MQLYYVWYDHLLEELFSMEKDDFEKEHIALKNALEREKVVFHTIQADNIAHAFEVYRNTLPTMSIDLDDDSPHLFTTNKRSRLIH
jgi:hypothetical protein